MRGPAVWYVPCLLASWLGACAYAPIKGHLPADGGDGGSEAGFEDGAFDAPLDTAFDAPPDTSQGSANDAGDAEPDASDGGLDASDGATGSVLRVEPLFPAAPRWNDSVVDPNPSDHLIGALLPWDAAACTADKEPLNAASCVHGGVLRQLVLSDQTECDGLVLSDARDWFYWECVERDGHVVFVGEGLRSGIDLRDLLDLSEPAQPRWQTNQITVRRGNDIVAQTEAQAFWSNPVIAIDDDAPAGGHTLDVEGAVYVVTTRLQARLRVLADHVTLTTLDGLRLEGGGFSSAPLVEAQDRTFFRMERVEIDSNGYTTALDLHVTFSTLAHVMITRSGPGPGSAADARIHAFASVIDDVKTERAAADGAEISGAANVVSWLRAYNAGARGLVLRANNSRFDTIEAHQSGSSGVQMAMQASQLRGVHVSRSGADGVRMEGSRYCQLTTITVTHSGQAGVIVTGTSLAPDDTELNVLRDVLSTNNGTHGVALRGRNQVLSIAIAANNDTGVDVNGSSHLIQHVTATNNAEAGVSLSSGQDAQVINLVAINNKHGLHLQSDAENARLHDIVTAHNGTDVLLEGEDNAFTGVLMLTAENACDVSPILMAPGLVEGASCTNAGASEASISAPHNFGQALVGMLSAGDALNGHYPDLQQPYGNMLSSQITDWLGFSVRQRHWGKHVVAPFPGATFAGNCRASDAQCVTWDWRVAGASLLKDVFGAILVTSALDEVVHQRSHHWSVTGATACQTIPDADWDGTTCASTFLAYAFEDYDGTTDGNGNALCEVMEGCVLNRHRGGFPGQGDLEAVDFSVEGFGDLYLQRHVTAGP